jgi:hypothetical protein
MDTGTGTPLPDGFTQERARLLIALGKLTDGGCVDAIELLGPASLPGWPAPPGLDIGLAVWPFPLDPSRAAALAGLGYLALAAADGALAQRFRHSARKDHLAG